MIEIGGYIIGAITLVLGFVVGIHQRAEDTAIKIRGKVRDELGEAYQGLANALSWKGIVREGVEASVSRLERLHASLHDSTAVLRKCEAHSRAALPLAISAIAVAGGTLVAGSLATPGDFSTASLVLLVGVPAFAALVEMGFLCLLSSEERQLKRMYDMYNRSEY